MCRDSSSSRDSDSSRAAERQQDEFGAIPVALGPSCNFAMLEWLVSRLPVPSMTDCCLVAEQSLAASWHSKDPMLLLSQLKQKSA